VEHPAAGYRKIFETVEELNEPIPAEITGRKERPRASTQTNRDAPIDRPVFIKNR